MKYWAPGRQRREVLILFTQLGATSCNGWCVLTPQAEQGLEGDHGSSPPIEAKHELIQIGLEVLVGNSMFCPTQPSLEIAKDSMNMRQDLMRPFGGALRRWSMTVPQFGQAIQPSLVALLRFEIQGVALAA